jgi:hypothetical protein
MQTTTNLRQFTAKRDGYHEQREMLRETLLALYKGADSTFWIQKDIDPNYADPRTDYLLGKRDAISDLISYIDKTMSHHGETINN